jgi:hypothetical protein
VVAVDAEEWPIAQLRERGQEILRPRGSLEDQLCVEFGKDIPTSCGMEAVKEGRTGEGFVEDLAIGLEKVSPARGLAEGALDPATEEPEIIQRTVAVNTADVIGENAGGRSHELVEKVGICHSIIGGTGRQTGAKMHS